MLLHITRYSELTLMALTVSNHNGTLPADHIWILNLFQEFYTQQISFDRNLTFIDHVLSLLLGVWVFTRIPAAEFFNLL